MSIFFGSGIDSTTSCLLASSRAARPFLDFLYPASLWKSSSRPADLGQLQQRYYHCHGVQHPRRHTAGQLSRACSQQQRRPGRSRSTTGQFDNQELSSPSVMESLFLNALLRAGSCREDVQRSNTTWWSAMDIRTSSLLPMTLHHKSRRKRAGKFSASAGSGLPHRQLTTVPDGRRYGHAQAMQLSREEVGGLVDMYDTNYHCSEALALDVGRLKEQGSERQSQQLAPEAAYSPRLDEDDSNGACHGERRSGGEGHEHQAPPIRRIRARYSQANLGPEGKEAIARLEALLQDEHSPHDDVYIAYRSLPQPGVAFLAKHTIGTLLHHLAAVEHRTETGMLRYMSLLDDLKAVGMPILPTQWSSAIAFAGYCMRRVTADEVQSALLVWRQMEHDAGVRGNQVTFNILFDVATKAHRFVLAEKILQEMTARGLMLSRFNRVALIYHYGLRGDGDGVRRSYRDLINNGCIVDTLVLNCVITSLFRSGEPSAAEHVFERMKQLHDSKMAEYYSQFSSRKTSFAPPPLFPTYWRDVRALGKALTRASETLHDDDAARQCAQDASPIAPSTRTYKILIEHHTRHLGNLDRVATLLAEMPHYALRPSGAIFHAVLRGFADHGGALYSSWTGERLESVWAAYLEIMDVQMRQKDSEFLNAAADTSRRENANDALRFSAAIASAALSAFARCSGVDRTMEVWAEIRRRWKPEAEEMGGLVDLIGRLAPNRRMDWQMQ